MTEQNITKSLVTWEDNEGVTESDAYISTLPEGLTSEDVLAVRQHDIAFQAKLLEETIAHGNSVFSDSPDNDTVNVSADMLGGTSVTATMTGMHSPLLFQELSDDELIASQLAKQAELYAKL